MTTALVGIGRLENRYAREWVEHHLRTGFDTIIIADNNHRGEDRFEDVLQTHIDDGTVIILDYRD
jgi:predicted ThiF/HesA family dinucleotide-utilizing enzyme